MAALLAAVLGTCLASLLAALLEAFLTAFLQAGFATLRASFFAEFLAARLAASLAAFCDNAERTARGGVAELTPLGKQSMRDRTAAAVANVLTNHPGIGVFYAEIRAMGRKRRAANPA